MVNNNAQAQQLLAQSGQRTVPQIFIDEKSVGGFTELSKLLNNSDFDLTNPQFLI